MNFSPSANTLGGLPSGILYVRNLAARGGLCGAAGRGHDQGRDQGHDHQAQSGARFGGRACGVRVSAVRVCAGECGAGMSAHHG
jgi:hypothetical protein